MHDFDHLAEALQPHYSHFNVANRLLFTGHSHQAWPDAAFLGIQEYMQTVADKVDAKWEPAEEKTEMLRSYLRNWYDDPNGRYCREQNTHVLIVSWLSSLPLIEKPKIITTEGEFHSLRRQLQSLEQHGIEIVRLPAESDQRLTEELKKTIDSNTCAVMMSRVYYQSARINTAIPEIATVCRKHNVPLLIDDYHGTNVAPLSLRNEPMDDLFLLIGGYKYLQWGEANCFLRFPSNCTLKPAITGWFAAFGELEKPQDGTVSFDDGDQRFATATYDPISQFRAAEVVRFFRTQGLSPQVLEKQYRDQVQFLGSLFDDRNPDPSVIRRTHNAPPEQTGGFLSLTSPYARDLRTKLFEKGIYTDARDNILRLGPAPYITSKQCIDVIDALFEEIDHL